MNTRPTLQADEALVKRAKAEARRRGKSVSRMVAELLESLGRPAAGTRRLPPVTASLIGVLKEHRVSEEDYRAHLRNKYR